MVFAGGIDSDSATEMSNMRVNILPILEAAGVDVIVGGHSHNYERSQVWSFVIDLSNTARCLRLDPLKKIVCDL